jgi:hypothetical protein
MRRLIMFLAALGTLAVPTSIAVIAQASPASAAVSLTCAKLKGSESGPVTVKKCSVPKADKKLYKSAGAPSALALASGGTLTWSSSGKTTTFSAPTLSSPTGNCKAKDTEELAVGRVTGGTSAVTHAGDTFRAEVCIASNGKITLAKGTVVDL